ncbi:MAG: hypothetical protein HY784_13415, partial [Chloroflexi bacterium]|nr:hypothetical protein [Chloroflexota bacterium]
LTLMGYLGGEYSHKKSFSFTAQVTFEQSYSEIDGDSASCTELYAIVSSLAGVPLKQNIAVTGTLNQRGQVQPIGGVTEKVEGFYQLCARRGLTGEQGVMIPAANRHDLNLRPEVVQAAAQGKFHVWTVETVEEGLELLTGTPAAEIHAKVRQRLKELDSDGRGAHALRKDNRLPVRLQRWLTRLRKRLPGIPRRRKK